MLQDITQYLIKGSYIIVLGAITFKKVLARPKVIPYTILY